MSDFHQLDDWQACLRQPDGTVLRLQLHGDVATGFGMLEPGTLRLVDFLRINPSMFRGGCSHNDRSYSNLWDEVNGDNAVELNGRPPRWSAARTLLDLRQMLHACQDDTRQLASKIKGLTVGDVGPAIFAKSDAFEASPGLVGLRSDIDRAVKRAPQFLCCPQLEGMKGLEAFGSILIAAGLVQPRKTKENTVPARLKKLGFTKAILYPKKPKAEPKAEPPLKKVKAEPKEEPPKKVKAEPEPEVLAVALAVATKVLDGDSNEGETPPAAEEDYELSQALLEESVDFLPGSEDDMSEDETQEPAGMSSVERELQQQQLHAVMDERDAQLEAMCAKFMDKLEEKDALIKQLLAQLQAAPRSPSNQRLLAHERDARAAAPATPRTLLPRRAKRAREG